MKLGSSWAQRHTLTRTTTCTSASASEKHPTNINRYGTSTRQQQTNKKADDCPLPSKNWAKGYRGEGTSLSIPAPPAKTLGASRACPTLLRRCGAFPWVSQAVAPLPRPGKSTTLCRFPQSAWPHALLVSDCLAERLALCNTAHTGSGSMYNRAGHEGVLVAPLPLPPRGERNRFARHAWQTERGGRRIGSGFRLPDFGWVWYGML